VAELVPPVIPPLSAFAPLRDKLREAAAARKSAAAAPVHPATYSPAPTAAAPAAMPLPYQGGAVQPYPAQPYPGGQPYGQPYAGAMQPYQSAPAPYQTPAPAPAPQQRPAASAPKPEKAAPTGRRTAVVVGLMFALTGFTALYAVPGAIAAVLLLVLARTVDRSSTALMRRRQIRGRSGKSDGVIAAAASPIQLVTAGLITLPCLILPLITGAIVGGIVTGVAATANGLDWPPLSAVGFAGATLSALFTAWWGPGGSSLRRGGHIAARNLFRSHVLSTAIAVVLLVVGVFCFYQATQGAGSYRNPIETPQIDRPTLGDLRQAPFIRDLPVIGTN
jgi:hypothetical protein